MFSKIDLSLQLSRLILLSVCSYLPQSLLASPSIPELPKSFKIDGIKLIRVNPGTFTMGAPNMPPQSEPYEGLRIVNMNKVFYLAETEVSQAMWDKHMKINPSRFQSPSLPVEGITWKEAMDFCEKLNKIKDTLSVPDKMIFRLPSEAEWEYSARAGSKTTFFFGENPKPLTNYAWISENSEGSTKPIGLLEPNKWGFFDIYGNVREWCLDGYEPRPSGQLNSPLLGWKNMDKVNRGGSWDSCDACCKTAKRMNYGPDYQSSDIGFRLALGEPFLEMTQQ